MEKFPADNIKSELSSVNGKYYIFSGKKENVCSVTFFIDNGQKVL